jgi:hypothetical protein
MQIEFRYHVASVLTVYVSYKHSLCITACEYGVLGGSDSYIIHH